MLVKVPLLPIERHVVMAMFVFRHVAELVLSFYRPDLSDSFVSLPKLAILIHAIANKLTRVRPSVSWYTRSIKTNVAIRACRGENEGNVAVYIVVLELKPVGRTLYLT